MTVVGYSISGIGYISNDDEKDEEKEDEEARGKRPSTRTTKRSNRIVSNVARSP